MSDDDYTPTTEVIRQLYTVARYETGEVNNPRFRAEFDRWLNQETRKNLREEVVWMVSPFGSHLPPLEMRDGVTYYAGTHVRLQLTDEQYRANGWVKKRRWVTDWEEVED